MEFLMEVETILGKRDWDLLNISIGEEEDSFSFELRSNLGMCEITVYNSSDVWVSTSRKDNFSLDYSEDTLIIASNGYTLTIKINEFTEFYIYEM